MHHLLVKSGPMYVVQVEIMMSRNLDLFALNASHFREFQRLTFRQIPML